MQSVKKNEVAEDTWFNKNIIQNNSHKDHYWVQETNKEITICAKEPIHVRETSLHSHDFSKYMHKRWMGNGAY